MKIIYKITYPNGKIYIGKDLTNTLNYFGSANSKLIEEDFDKNTINSFTITKEVLYKSTSTSEINRMEVELIKKHNSNDPLVGYNRWPKK